MASDRRIVIVGGGLAGHRIAFALQHEARVTLIDPKEFFEIPMAVPRLLVQPGRAEEALLPYSQFLAGVELVRDRVQSVQPGFVRVASGTSIPYDVLVLATGSSYPTDTLKASIGGVPERISHFGRLAEQVKAARRILIVGGGPVGVEIAGEILQDLPGKHVVMVQSGETILPSITPGPRRYALEFLRARGAGIQLGRKVDDSDLAAADLVLWCAGYDVDTSYLRDFPGLELDPSGRVPVDQYLRMRGTDNVFVAGDITALPEPKLGIWAGKHAAVIIENIRRCLRGNTGLKSYRPATGSRMMLVTLGRSHGTGHTPLGDFTNSWLARKFKATDMFIGRYRKAVGL